MIFKCFFLLKKRNCVFESHLRETTFLSTPRTKETPHPPFNLATKNTKLSCKFWIDNYMVPNYYWTYAGI